MHTNDRYLSLAFLVLTACGSSPRWGVRNPDVPNYDPPRYATESFRETIAHVVNMPQDAALRDQAGSVGLDLVNVMWEDTGRTVGSSGGPNISDVTLQVREPSGQTHLLPVFRFPNFTDRTADVRADKIWVLVGNHRGDELEPVPLSQVLGNLRAYISDPGSLVSSGNFNAARDSHYLVSAQHVFVPVQREGKAEFNPVLYNYQSSPGNPAVLVILATRQGTSVAVENRPGDQSMQGWGQQLFFNHEGERTYFTAERRSAVERRIARGEAEAQDEGALDPGADMMMLIQVPLRHREYVAQGWGGIGGGGYVVDSLADGAPAEEAAAAPASAAPSMRSNVETAVIGHGEDLGRFAGMQGLSLERDPRFPIRVTVQFYRATSNGVVDRGDLLAVRDQIDRVYADGDYVGSLVVPESRMHRPTESQHVQVCSRRVCTLPPRGCRIVGCNCELACEPQPVIVDQYVN